MTKTLLLFGLGNLLLLTTVIGKLLSGDSPDLKDLKPKDVQITIISGDKLTGKLTLGPGEDSIVAYSEKKVAWTIAKGSNVDSFYITKKEGSEEIFSNGQHPPSRPAKSGVGKIKKISHHAIYEYSIQWREGDTADDSAEWQTYDPKIAVKPSAL